MGRILSGARAAVLVAVCVAACFAGMLGVAVTYGGAVHAREQAERRDAIERQLAELDSLIVQQKCVEQQLQATGRLRFGGDW